MLANWASYNKKMLAWQVIPLAPVYLTALSPCPEIPQKIKNKTKIEKKCIKQVFTLGHFTALNLSQSTYYYFHCFVPKPLSAQISLLFCFQRKQLFLFWKVSPLATTQPAFHKQQKVCIWARWFIKLDFSPVSVAWSNKEYFPLSPGWDASHSQGYPSIKLKKHWQREALWLKVHWPHGKFPHHWIKQTRFES